MTKAMYFNAHHIGWAVVCNMCSSILR